MSVTTLPETRTLELELEHQWLTVRLNEVDSRNALTHALSDELKAILLAVRHDRRVRGISLRGNGGVFCAGGDLKAFSALRTLEGEAAAEAAVATSMDGAELFALVHSAPQVVIALVEGAAVAGGLGLACAADFAFATQDAVLAFSETRLGLAPAQIAPYVIAKTGLRRGRRLLLTGVRLNGAEAFESGLIDGVASNPAELEQLESVLINEVLECAPGAIDATKQVIADVAGVDIEAFQPRAAAVFAQCLVSDEGREGVAAFFRKRPPSWAPDAEN